MIVVFALVAFFAPVAAGLCVPRTHMPGVWLTSAMLEVPVCLLLHQPLGAAAAVLSMILAAMAVGVSRPHPSRRRARRQENRAVRALRRDLKAFGRRDLEHAEQYDPKLGDERVWEAPRPRRGRHDL